MSDMPILPPNGRDNLTVVSSQPQMLPSQVFRPALRPYRLIRELILEPRVCAMFAIGSGQLTVHIPEGAEALYRAWETIPSTKALIDCRNTITAALRTKTRPKDVAGVLAAALATKLTASAAQRATFMDGSLFVLTEEAAIRRISPFVLAAAIYRAVVAKPFVPDVAEILAEVEQVEGIFRSTPRRADMLIEAKWEIEERLQKLEIFVDELAEVGDEIPF